jgi:hypothetical protein
VVDALALVTALAIDPRAAQLAPSRSPVSSAPPAHEDSPQTPHTSAPGYGVNDGAEFVLLTAVAPDVLAGGDIYVELESDRPGLLAPSFRAAILFTQNRVFASPSATFALIAGRFEVCPTRFGSRDAWLRGCLATDVGLLRGQGADVPHPYLAKEGWFDAGVVARGRWSPSGASLFLEIAGGAIFPITQPTFVYVRPRVVVQPVPSVAGTVSVGAGVHFW